MRVLLVNTSRLPDKADWPHSLLDFTNPKWKGKFAMARPQFGTTATQAACIFQMLGTDRAQEYFHKVRENEVVLLPGNKQVAVAVGKGHVAFGVTDTDDAYAEIEAGKPVVMIFPDQPAEAGNNDTGMATLFIPNTVALIKNCPNPEGGKKLIDYLLKPEVELALATSASRQVPLNPNVKAEGLAVKLPDWEAYAKRVDFRKIVERWDEAQQFVAQEFRPQ